MWNYASNAIAGSMGTRTSSYTCTKTDPECSDDEVSSCGSNDDCLECPICWESFNLVENVPYVLWCGHTMCMNCILGLQWAVVKFPTVPVQLPLFISCPWCNLLSLRLVYKGKLYFPRKNYFLLWMVESMNGARAKSQPSTHADHAPVLTPNNGPVAGQVLRPPNLHAENFSFSTDHVALISNFLGQLSTKFPLVIIFLLIVLYAIPASAVVLALYVLITILFAVPSALIVCFAYPSLEWLVREIIS